MLSTGVWKTEVNGVCTKYVRVTSGPTGHLVFANIVGPLLTDASDFGSGAGSEGLVVDVTFSGGGGAGADVVLALSAASSASSLAMRSRAAFSSVWSEHPEARKIRVAARVRRQGVTKASWQEMPLIVWPNE